MSDIIFSKTELGKLIQNLKKEKSNNSKENKNTYNYQKLIDKENNYHARAMKEKEMELNKLKYANIDKEIELKYANIDKEIELIKAQAELIQAQADLELAKNNNNASAKKSPTNKQKRNAIKI